MKREGDNTISILCKKTRKGNKLANYQTKEEITRHMENNYYLANEKMEQTKSTEN